MEYYWLTPRGKFCTLKREEDKSIGCLCAYYVVLSWRRNEAAKKNRAPDSQVTVVTALLIY